jgi:hypothetical protein
VAVRHATLREVAGKATQVTRRYSPGPVIVRQIRGKVACGIKGIRMGTVLAGDSHGHERHFHFAPSEYSKKRFDDFGVELRTRTLDDQFAGFEG